MAKLFSILLVFIICLNLCYFVGVLIRRYFNYTGKGWKDIFYSLTVGWFTLSIVLALYYSDGTTSLIVPGLFIIFYFLFYKAGKRTKRDQLFFSTISVKPLLRLNVIGGITFLFNWVILAGFNIQSALYPSNDFAYYSRLSKFLIDTGYESGNIDYFYPYAHKKIPYHYIEHWFVGGISELSQIVSGHIFPLLYIPLLVVILYFGFLAIFDKHNKKTWKSYAFAFVAFFVSGFAFIYPNQIEFFHVFIHDWSVFKFIKLLPVYILFVCVLFELDQKNYIQATCLALFSGLVYSSTLPAAVCIALLLWIVTLSLEIKTRHRIKEALIFGLVIVLVLIGFALFYYQPHIPKQDSNFETFSNIDFKGYIRTSVNIILKISFAILLVLSPYVIYAFSIKKWEKENYKMHVIRYAPFYLLMISAIVSVIPYSILHTMPNAHQFYRSMYFVCGNVGAIWLISLGLDSNIRKIKYVAYLLLVMNPMVHLYYIPMHETQTLTKGDYLKYADVFKKEDIKLLYFRNEPNNTSYYLTATAVFLPANFLQLYLDPVQLACANPETILKEKVTDYIPVMRSHVRSSPINRLHMELYGSNMDENLNPDIYRNFIDEFNIEGIIVKNNFELPESIRDLVINKISLSEEYSIYEISK